MGNLIVGQSGGPSSVINSSLAGVYVIAKKRGVEKVYGMRNGIEGFLADHIETVVVSILQFDSVHFPADEIL